MPELHYTVDGTCYQIDGDIEANPVVVLIHGVGLDQSLWQQWVSSLSGDYAIVSYDLLGHGNTVNPPGRRCLDDFSDQLSRLLDELGIPSCHLIGFSLGALVALQFASLHCQRLLSLTLLHCVYQRTAEQLQAIRQRYALTRDQGPMATVELAIERWFSKDWIAHHAEVGDAIRAGFARHTDDGYLKAYGVFCEADAAISKTDPGAIDCPCLLITGSLEPGSTPAMSEALGRDLNGTVIINEGHLHMAPVEHATVLIHQVTQFLERAE